jgi:hypothetical protein
MDFHFRDTPKIANQPILVGNCEEISFACDYTSRIFLAPLAGYQV